MNKNSLITAVAEAHRFIARAEELQQAYDKYDNWERANPEDRRERYVFNPNSNPFTGSKESGAVRRASMDLTRALSELRKYD